MITPNRFRLTERVELYELPARDPYSLFALFPYRLFVDIDDENPGLIMQISVLRTDLGRYEEYPRFTGFLSAFLGKTFMKELIFSTFFQRMPGFLLKKDNKGRKVIHGDHVIDEMLMPSRGMILYAYQLEQLNCMLIGVSYSSSQFALDRIETSGSRSLERLLHNC
jgi:hypothetical protein